MKMNFKVGDEVTVNKQGGILFPKLKNASGIISKIIENDISPIHGRVIYVNWQKSTLYHYPFSFAIWSINLIKKKPKTHNHPLTSIFAGKMPKRKRLTKSKKRGKV